MAAGITNLPIEILENIFAQVPFLDLTKNCIGVCKYWYEIISNPKFLIWKKSYHRLLAGSEATAEKMEEIMDDEGFFSVPHMLPLNIAKFMKGFKPLREGSSLVDSLKQHRKFPMIRSFLKALSKKIEKSPWSILSLLCLVSTSVSDVTQVITSMLQEKSCLSYDVIEALYLLACFLWILKSQNRVNSGLAISDLAVGI
ncbi:hypothetical protein QZH41_016498 [Actinostola sp. cb2023]|nr:hypothetical protein QZH41_016498 [Actinostola sp. cb2023]